MKVSWLGISGLCRSKNHPLESLSRYRERHTVGESVERTANSEPAVVRPPLEKTDAASRRTIRTLARLTRQFQRLERSWIRRLRLLRPFRSRGRFRRSVLRRVWIGRIARFRVAFAIRSEDSISFGSITRGSTATVLYRTVHRK